MGRVATGFKRRLTNRTLEAVYEFLTREVVRLVNEMRIVLNANVGTVVEVSSDYTVAAGVQWVFVDATAGPVSVTLPPVTTTMAITVKSTNSGGSNVTVLPPSGALIDGASSSVFSPLSNFTYKSDERAGWWRIF